MSDRLLRNLRAIAFGLVWSYLLFAVGIKMWSLLWWCSLLPAICTFGFIEGIVGVLLFNECEDECKHDSY